MEEKCQALKCWSIMCVTDVSHSSMEIQAPAFFKEGVALGKMLFVVNLGGT